MNYTIGIMSITRNATRKAKIWKKSPGKYLIRPFLLLAIIMTPFHLRNS